LAFSYWFDKPQFLTEGRLATVLIIPSSWGSQLGGYLPTSDARDEEEEEEKEVGEPVDLIDVDTGVKGRRRHQSSN
jgi:hypothetical protein